MKQSSGFNLVELIIVLAIIGIIAAVATPSFLDSSKKGRRGDGQAALLDAASKMEAYFFTNRTYTTDLTDLGYSAETGVATTEGFYTIGVNAATGSCPIASCFELQATAIGGQIEDGNLTIDSLGRRLPSSHW